jgi:hypothetical protein
MGLCLVALGCEGELIDPGFPGQNNPPGSTAALSIRLGGVGFDQVVDVLTDPAGNVLVTGTFTGSVDFDPDSGVTALTSIGLADVFLAKYDPAGVLVWADRIGGTSADDVSGLARDAAGNLYLAGTFEGASDFDPGPGVQFLTSEGAGDGYVAKFASGGDLVWARRYGGIAQDALSDVATDPAGNVYASGTFSGLAEALPLAGGVIVSDGALQDGFLLALDPSGAVRYAFAVGGTGADAASAVTVTADGSVVVAGSFQGLADFGPGTAVAPLTSEGGTDGFVASYTSAGTLRWLRAITGVGDEDVQRGSLAADAHGGVVVSGGFVGTTTFAAGTGSLTRTSLGGSDWYVAALDASGLFTSVFSVGGAGSDAAPQIAVDADDNLLATGRFLGPVDFDPGLVNRTLSSLATQGSDGFVARYSRSGGVIWVTEFGEVTAAPDRVNTGTAVASGPAGTVLVGGRFFGSPNFGSTAAPFALTSLGDADGFLVKLSSTGVLARNP